MVLKRQLSESLSASDGNHEVHFESRTRYGISSDSYDSSESQNKNHQFGSEGGFIASRGIGGGGRVDQISGARNVMSTVNPAMTASTKKASSKYPRSATTPKRNGLSAPTAVYPVRRIPKPVP